MAVRAGDRRVAVTAAPYADPVGWWRGIVPRVQRVYPRPKEVPMRNCIALALALVLAGFAFAENGRTIQVEVTYTGAGKVDASHKIYVALWDSPDMNSGPP